MKKYFLFFFVGLFAFMGCSKDYEKITKNHLSVYGKTTKEDVGFFDEFYSAMVKAIEQKNIEKSFSFYSKEFPADLNKLKVNTQTLYNNYKNIIYVPESIIVNVQGDSAITSDKFTYSAQPMDIKKYEPLNYAGKERIYWKKEDNQWKIINWIYY